MELKDGLSDLTILFSASAATFIAVISWSKAASKDRRQHIFQKRLNYRLSMLDSLVEVFVSLNNGPEPFKTDKDLLEKMRKARFMVQLYGYRDEREPYENLIRNLEERDIGTFQKTLDVLIPMVRMKIRNELEYADEDNRLSWPSGSYVYGPREAKTNAD